MRSARCAHEDAGAVGGDVLDDVGAGDFIHHLAVDQQSCAQHMGARAGDLDCAVAGEPCATRGGLAAIGGINDGQGRVAGGEVHVHIAVVHTGFLVGLETEQGADVIVGHINGLAVGIGEEAVAGDATDGV